MPLSTVPTAKQRRIYQTFIKLYEEGGGVAPTVRELAVATGQSSIGTTHHHLYKLVAAGLLEHREGRTPAFLPTRRYDTQLRYNTEGVILKAVVEYLDAHSDEPWSVELQEIMGKAFASIEALNPE